MTGTGPASASPSGRLREALAAALPIVVLVAAPFVVFVRVWAGAGGDAAHFYGDTTGSYWPDLVLQWRALKEGSFPLWNPFDRAGYPFCADPQTGALYPVDWLFALVGLLRGGVSFGLLQLKVLLHLSLAGVALYAFVRGRGLPRPAGVVGGLAWQLGAWMMHNAHFALAWPAAWFPLVLLGVDRLARRPTFGAGATLGLLGGLLALAGSPPSAWYALLVVAPYLALRVVQERAHGLRALAPPLLLAAVVAAALALPGVLASAVLTQHSVLATRDFGFVASGSLSFASLDGLFLRSGERLYVYAGAVALGLAVVGLVAGGGREGRRGSHVAFFAAVALVGLLLALGRHALLLRLLYETVPGFGLFRLAFRYLFLFSAGVAVLAAYGVAAAIERPERCRGVARGLGWAAAVLAGVALLASTADKLVTGEQKVADLWFVALLVALLGAALLARVRRALPASGLAVALVLLVLLDYGAHARRADLLRGGRFDPAPKLAPEQVAALVAQRDAWRVYAEFALNWRPGTRLGLRDFRGYMDPLRLQRYDDVIQALHRHPALLERFNVRHVLAAPHPYHGTGHHHVKRPERIPGAERRSPHVYELADPAPAAYWVGRVKLVDEPAQALRALPRLGRDEIVMARADLGEGEAAAIAPYAEAAGDPPPRVAAEVVARTMNGLRLTVDAPADGVLLVNEAWFPGWRATVDGVRAPLLRADHLLQAVPIAAGRHEVALRFRPTWFVVPAWIAALTLLALAGVAVAQRLRRRRRWGGGRPAPGVAEEAT